MYSKVNSVVLDTAAINGGQIKAAVGGELEDVVFWGDSVRSGSKFVTNTVQYALNGAVVRVYDISLRGLSIGNSVPDSVHADDALIKSGIWQSGGKYRISDTYNAATGEYVQRVGSAVYDGSEAWTLVKKTDKNLVANYTLKTVAKRTENKKALCELMGFNYSPDRPLVIACFKSFLAFLSSQLNFSNCYSVT